MTYCGCSWFVLCDRCHPDNPGVSEKSIRRWGRRSQSQMGLAPIREHCRSCAALPLIAARK
jgi:hypothetical protein